MHNVIIEQTPLKLQADQVDDINFDYFSLREKIHWSKKFVYEFTNAQAQNLG